MIYQDKEYRYHKQYLGRKDDDRAKSARKHVPELTQEDKELDQVANDIIEESESE